MPRFQNVWPGCDRPEGKLAEAEVAGVRLTHPDKVLYPDQGITKLDLARYYEQVAEWMLPHRGEPADCLVRCPAGSGRKVFLSKASWRGQPAKRCGASKSKRKARARTIWSWTTSPGLVSLVQMGVLEIHVWGSRADKVGTARPPDV